MQDIICKKAQIFSWNLIITYYKSSLSKKKKKNHLVKKNVNTNTLTFCFVYM